MSPNFPIFMKTLTPRSKQKLSVIDMKKTTPKKPNCPKPAIERKIWKAPREKRHFTGNKDKDTVTQKQMKLWGEADSTTISEGDFHPCQWVRGQAGRWAGAGGWTTPSATVTQTATDSAPFTNLDHVVGITQVSVTFKDSGHMACSLTTTE